MQKIDSLLKLIVTQKDESEDVIQCVFSVSGIRFDRKDIVFSNMKDSKRVKLVTSGAQKTKLVLCMDELRKELSKLGFVLTL